MAKITIILQISITLHKKTKMQTDNKLQNKKKRSKEVELKGAAASRSHPSLLIEQNLSF